MTVQDDVTLENVLVMCSRRAHSFRILGIGTLAFASADGKFSVISISCALEWNSDTGILSPSFDFEHNGLLDVKNLDRRGITSMQWVFPSDGSQVSYTVGVYGSRLTQVDYS